MTNSHSENNSATVEYPPLYLKRNEDARLRGGHLWVFSNEVDVQRSPLASFKTGETVVIVAANDQPIGVGYINPHSLICARLLQRGTNHAIDKSLFVHKLNVALSLRERLYDTPHYRWVYGESDGLPGLVLDRFGDVVVGQIATAGMEQHKDDIVTAVKQVIAPRAMVWKNDSSIRKLEGLPDDVAMAFGDLNEPVYVHEGGLKFEVDLLGGQKTGWFFDQHANRDQLAKYVQGKRVLDLFSYLGGWGLRAAAAGASEVICVDSSDKAVQAIEKNIKLNNLQPIARAVKAEVFEELTKLRHLRERFDVVILDPPAFIKRKKDMREGTLGYRRVNEAAMRVLNHDGILISASCSYHLSRASLLDQINQGARHLDRQAQVLVQLQQGPDHPIVPAIAETEYLKGFILRILRV